MKCLQCGVDFEAVRASAKYCSSLCRVRYGRVSVTDGPLSVTENLSVTSEDDLSVTEVGVPARVVELERDLYLDLKKDLGITSWTADGIFLCNDITIDQVQNIARLVHAKRGRVCPKFLECR